jgi:NTE family protein
MDHVGIAFGGGAARGIAHIGALRAIRNRPEFLPTIVAGTSAGSIVASLYAAGLHQEQMETLADEFDWFRDVVSLSDTVRRVFDSRRGGMISNAQLGRQMDALVGGRSFDDLDVDLAIVAMDLGNLQRIIFTSRRVADRMNPEELYRFLPEPTDRMPGCGTRIVTDCESIGLAVRASCAVPGVFVPVEIQEMRLVDGGVVDQVPVDAIKAMGARLAIGISLALAFLPQKLNNTASVMSGMVGILGLQQLRRNLESADIGFQVRGIDRGSLINPQPADLLEMGEKAMVESLDAWESHEAAAGPIEKPA